MFAISLTSGRPQVDTMPVLKTTNYPFTAGSFKPLLYARAAAVRGEGLFLDLMAFERDPVVSAHADPGEMPLLDSCAAAAFNFFPSSSSAAIVVVSNAVGNAACYVAQPGGAQRLLDFPLQTETYAGEDEQGWYWGVRFMIPAELLRDVYGQSELRAGDTLRGNIFKFQRGGEFAHFGAVAPARSESIFDPASFADFLVTDY